MDEVLELYARRLDTDADAVGDLCDNCLIAPDAGQSAALFPEILDALPAQDGITWATAIAYEWARGSMTSPGELSSYLTDTTGTGNGSSLTDATLPAPGAVLWYRPRPDRTGASVAGGEGSWSAGGAAEQAGRDAGLAP